MRLVAAAHAPAGAPLARDVTPDPRSRSPLVRAGVPLTERHRAVLLEDGVAHVWVEDALGEGIEPPELLPAGLRRDLAEALHAVLLDARAALARRRAVARPLLEALRPLAGEVVAATQAHDGPAPALADGAGAHDYPLQHALDVCVLGTLLGVRAVEQGGLGGGKAVQRAGLPKLALGLLLADVGRPVLTPRAAEQEPLAARDLDLVRTHPAVGVELLGQDADLLVKSVVRGHHERWDGVGYPKGVPAREVHPFARIAAVADTYDAVTSPRPFRAAAPAAAGHAAVTGGSGTAFDPEVVALFAATVAPDPVGTTVVLADGRTAAVASDALGAEGLVVRVAGADGGVEVLHGPELAPADVSARVGTGVA